MHHVAIMDTSKRLVPKIISGEKLIESRWYQTRRAPWNTVHIGDTIFFKNSGQDVTAKAIVADVKQFEIHDIDTAARIVKKYGKQICLWNLDVTTWERLPKYCILIWLQKPTVIKTPFSINKKGFGNAAAWLTIKNIKDVSVLN